MAGPPSSVFMQATCIFSGVGLPEGAVTTLGMTAEATPEGRQEIADFLGTFHEDNFGINSTLDTVEFKVGPEATGPTFIVPVGATGLVTGEGAGPEVACLIHKRAASVSGRLHGRMYWPGLGESQVDSAGRLTSGSLSALQTAVGDLYDNITGVVSQLFIFSSVSSDPRTVTSLEVDSLTGTQRERKRR